MDDRIYEISISYRSRLNPMSGNTICVTDSHRIEGLEQAEKVMKHLRGLGFDPDMTVYHAPQRANDVMVKFAMGLTQWPVAKDEVLP
jgi:hypothetical protein